MKVLQVIPSLAARTGGPPVAVVDSALALRECGVNVTIFASDMAGPASAPPVGRVAPADLPRGAAQADVRLFPARAPHRIVFSPEMYRALASEVGRYDLVHIHSLFLFPQFAAYRQALRRSVPYVVSPRGALDPYMRQRSKLVKALNDLLWQRAFLERAALLHLTSEEEARLVRRIAPSVPRAVVPNGVRWAEFGALPDGWVFRERHLGGSAAPLVLYLGRISHKKGLDVLIRAFAIVRQAAPDARLAIAGPDDEGLTPGLRALAKHVDVSDAVVFTGMLAGDERLAALAAADVWALPSHSENFGNAVIEAMAASRAVVVSPGVNIAPELADADAGAVAEARAEPFAEAIVALLRDPVRRSALGTAAREFARWYDWSNVAPRMAAMYESVLRRN